MDKIPFQIIRSNRKSVGIELTRDGDVLVRAPYGVPKAGLSRIVMEKAGWIRRHQEKLAATREAAGADRLTPEDISRLADEAMHVIPERVRYYAAQLGVTWGRITIRNQKTRWGSCSSKGNLNFNCLLMLTPPEVIDSVVVHELCHRRHMDHSPAFYAEVYRVFPEYDRWNRWLKENGPALIRRMTG